MSSIDNDFFVFKFTQNGLRVYEKHELKIFLKKFLQQAKTAGSSAQGNTAGRQKYIFTPLKAHKKTHNKQNYCADSGKDNKRRQQKEDNCHNAAQNQKSNQNAAAAAKGMYLDIRRHLLLSFIIIISTAVIYSAFPGTFVFLCACALVYRHALKGIALLRTEHLRINLELIMAVRTFHCAGSNLVAAKITLHILVPPLTAAASAANPLR